MVKKFGFLLIIMIMLFGVSVLGAEELPTVSLIPDNTASVGEIVDIYVSITENSNICSGNMIIGYDNTVMEPISATHESLLAGSLYEYNLNHTDSSVKVSWCRLENLTAGGNLMKLSFLVKSADVDVHTKISIDKIKLTDFETNLLSANLNDSEFVVNANVLPAFSIDAPKQAYAGEAFDVNVILADNTLSCAGSCKLIYDNTKLEIVTANVGGALQNVYASVNPSNASNTVKLSWAGTKEMTNGGSILTITFKSKMGVSGDALFALEACKLYDSQDMSMAVTVGNTGNKTTILNAPPPDPFDLSGTTMTLGSSLSLDFAVDTSKLTGADNYAELTIVYADSGESETITVPQSEWTVYSGSIYTAKFTGMAAKQMNDVVTAIIYNAKGQQVSNPRSDSIASYSLRQIATGGNAAKKAKLRTLYVDMLNYGAAAQIQFTYDTANLANKALTATQKSWATVSVVTADNRVKGTGYAGSTLTLSDEIQLDLIFNNSAIGKDYSKLYAIATYTDHYGKSKQVRIDGTDFIKYGSTMCQVSITGMAVADYKVLVACTVYNANGIAVANASDSVESYANRNAESLGAMVDAIVKFGASSYAYFH